MKLSFAKLVAIPMMFVSFTANAIPGVSCKLVQSDLNFELLSVNSETKRPFKTHLKLSAAAMDVTPGKTKKELFDSIETIVAKAAGEGTELLLLPELLTLSLLPKNDENYSALTKTMGRDFYPEYTKLLTDLAVRYKIAIAGASTPRTVSDQVFNTSIMVLKDGKLFEQDKLFLTPEEVDWGWTPGTTLKIYETEWGRISTLICYDCQFPTLSAEISPYTPDLLLVPSMTGDSGFSRVNIAAAARAIEQHAFVAVTGATGEMWSLKGRSAVLSPYNENFSGTEASGEIGSDKLVTATLDMEKLRKSKAETGLYAGREIIGNGARKLVAVSISN